MIEFPDVWAESTVYAEDSAIDNGTKGEVVEDFTTPPPYVAAPIFSLTFVVKPVNLSDLSGFMITTDKRDAFGIADLEGEK